MNYLFTPMFQNPDQQSDQFAAPDQAPPEGDLKIVLRDLTLVDQPPAPAAADW